MAAPRLVFNTFHAHAHHNLQPSTALLLYRYVYDFYISPYPGVTPLVRVSQSASHVVTLALGIFDPDHTKTGDTKQQRWIGAGIYVQQSAGRIHLDMDHAKLQRGKETEYLLHLRRVGVAMVTPMLAIPFWLVLGFCVKGTLLFFSVLLSPCTC